MKYKQIPLKHIANIVMGQSPRSEYYNNKGDGIEFLQGVRTFGENYPVYDTYTTVYKKVAPKGSILFSVRAPVGRVNWADRKIAIGRGIASIEVKSMFSSKYIYYYFKNMGSLLDKKSTGTIFSSINIKDLGNLIITIPEQIEDQEYISNKLSKIDGKIELNRKINANLVA